MDATFCDEAYGTGSGLSGSDIFPQFSLSKIARDIWYPDDPVPANFDVPGLTLVVNNSFLIIYFSAVTCQRCFRMSFLSTVCSSSMRNS